MKQYKLQPVDDSTKWDDDLVRFPNYHFLQSWAWGEIKSSNGWKASRLQVKDKSKTIGAFLLLSRRIHSKIPVTIGYVPRGPLFDLKNVDLDRLLYTVELAAKNRGCAYVKVDTDINEKTDEGRAWKNALIENNWVLSDYQVQPKNTGMTDLLQNDENGEDKLLMNMKKTWRYNIRNAKRRGVSIREGDLNDMSKFYELYKETGKRQGFGIRSLDYYKNVYSSFKGGKDTDAMILLSEHPEEREPLSSAVFIRVHKKVWYFYAASSQKRRADMPNYPLQWEALKWARGQGAELYDWGGASTNLDDPKDPMASVWHFKKGFGAEFFPGVGAWDKPIDTFQWYLLLVLSRIRKIFKR